VGAVLPLRAELFFSFLYMLNGAQTRHQIFNVLVNNEKIIINITLLNSFVS
jgi:hypothetical protein